MRRFLGQLIEDEPVVDDPTVTIRRSEDFGPDTESPYTHTHLDVGGGFGDFRSFGRPVEVSPWIQGVARRFEDPHPYPESIAGKRRVASRGAR